MSASLVGDYQDVAPRDVVVTLLYVHSAPHGRCSWTGRSRERKKSDTRDLGTSQNFMNILHGTRSQGFSCVGYGVLKVLLFTRVCALKWEVKQ